MIAISITSIENFSELSLNDEGQLEIAHVTKNYDKIASFFRECIDQNLILNCWQHADNTQGTSIYYSTDWDTAKLFEQKCQDTLSEFSLKKFWKEIDIDISISMEEIDFSTTDLMVENLDLLNESDRMIWNLYFD
jgi:hypothetical protein